MSTAFASRANASEMSAINITPLVDVMLVLLILFMVTAPMLTQRLDLPLSSPDTETTQPLVLSLQITAEGTVLLEGHTLSPQHLRSLLALESTRAEPPILRIESAAEAPYSAMADLMAQARNLGIDKIQLQSL